MFKWLKKKSGSYWLRFKLKFGLAHRGRTNVRKD